MESGPSSSAAGWEYMVIHLNIEPGPAASAPGAPKAPEGTGGEEGSGARPVFSETFLKKEFPQFYDTRPAQERPAQPQHPAQQLQTFLNGHGARGWELIGAFPIGVLTMLFFRRPRPAPEGVDPAPAPAAAEPPAPQVSPAAEAAPQAALLEAVLERLSALEQRLDPGREALSPARRELDPAPVSPRRQARRSPRPAAGGDGSGRPTILSEAQLARFADAPAQPSSTAAAAIGLRSAASLANHGARHGFRRGLVKVGPNGLAAVYVGSGAPQRGGVARRLWLVLPAAGLRG